MSSTQKLLGGRYQFIQALSTHQASQTFLAADVHYPGHPKCVVRQLQLPTRNPMTRKFILSLLKKKVEVLEGIGQHEQVPSTFAAFDFEQSFYIVQEFVPGRSLQDEIVVGQPWSQQDVLNLLKEVLPVIAFAQRHGVVHGNLKPSKMIRRKLDNRLVLLDFGSIKAISQNIASKETHQELEKISPLSRLYLSPEQYRRQALFCSDHYALGMLTIQALTGLPPEKLPTGQAANLQGEIVALLERIPDLGINAASLIARMVHPNPDRRYQKAVEILADLERLDRPTPSGEQTLLEPILPAPEDPDEAKANTSLPKLPYGLIGIAALALLTLTTALLGLRLPQKVLASRQMREAAALSADHPEAAIARYSQAIALSPQMPEALANRGQLYFELGDAEAALADLTQAIEQAPDYPDYVYDRANIRFAVGDVQGAIADYTQAIRQDDGFVKAYVNRGSARADWGDDKGAVEDYTRAIELTADTDTQAAAHLNRCLSYSNLGDQVLALDDCTHAINLRPSHQLAYQNRGLVRRRLGDFQGSLQDYNIAIQIAPDSPDPYYNRGLTRQAMNDLPGAMQDFSKAIAIDPHYVFAIYDRGLLQADLGNTTAAIADLRQASQLCLDLGRTGCYEDAQYQINRLQNSLTPTPGQAE